MLSASDNPTTRALLQFQTQATAFTPQEQLRSGVRWGHGSSCSCTSAPPQLDLFGFFLPCCLALLSSSHRGHRFFIALSTFRFSFLSFPAVCSSSSSKVAARRASTYVRVRAVVNVGERVRAPSHFIWQHPFAYPIDAVCKIVW